MSGRVRFGVVTTALAAMALTIVGAAGATGTQERVSAGSPPGPFAQNKQNEPAVAVDAHAPNVMAAGANDEIDLEACAAGDPTTCPFTQGVGVSGISFSLNGGDTWVQPTYQGYSARDCTGPAACTPHTGPIGTLPHYAEHGLASDGDPALAFGPELGTDGRFDWANGSRLYYANLTSSLDPANPGVKGFEAIAVSSTADVPAAAAGDASAWTDPVLVAKQSSTTFADKEQVWADNSAISPHFGAVYVCWAVFKSNSRGYALPTPLNVARSLDAGRTWSVKQVGPATDNGINSQPDGCTVRTDSHGNVYVLGLATRQGVPYVAMTVSADAGDHWSQLRLLAPVVRPGVLDPVQGRPVMDGLAGARVDLASGPSADIANGAPDGQGATNQIVVTWADGRDGLNHESLMLMTASGGQWTTPVAVPLLAGDRPVYTAPAISPNGTDVYVTYNAFTTPYRDDVTSPRGLVGSILHADVTGGAIGPFAALVRGAVGDPRGSSANALSGEFLGDYVYTAATRTGAVGVWNDTRNASDCGPVDTWRLSLQQGTTGTRPAPNSDCALTFGNSDIYGTAVSDPTP
jgi:hypothetical protein